MNIPHKTLLTVLLSCPLLPWAHAGGGGKAPAKSDRSTPPPSDTGKWRWNVQAGAAYRHFGGVDFQSGSLSSAALLPALRPRLGGGLGNRSTIGSATDFADRTYQDGFVFKDDDTTRLDSFLPGTTAYGEAAEGDGETGQLIFNTEGLRFENISQEGPLLIDSCTGPVVRALNTVPLGQSFFASPNTINDFFDDPRLAAT
jgi:hypothetical protein